MYMHTLIDNDSFDSSRDWSLIPLRQGEATNAADEASYFDMF
jgi:hypothetical protein